jgi:hypothetical protein
MKKMIVLIIVFAFCSCKKYRVCTCITTVTGITQHGTDTTITNTGREAIYGTKSYDAAKCTAMQESVLGTSITCSLN